MIRSGRGIISQVQCQKLLEDIILNADTSRFKDFKLGDCGISFGTSKHSYGGIWVESDDDGLYFTTDVPMPVGDYLDWEERMERRCGCDYAILHNYADSRDLRRDWNRGIGHAHAECRPETWRCATRQVLT